MIISNGYDDIAFTELVESLGADVVIDDHCLGLRYFWGDAVVDKEPMTALALWYLKEKAVCPPWDWAYGQRITRLLQLVKEYDVEAVISLAQMFCGTHQWDQVDIVSAFKKEGIPILSLEADVTIPAGPFRTRIEAMLEMVQSELF